MSRAVPWNPAVEGRAPAWLRGAWAAVAGAVLASALALPASAQPSAPATVDASANTGLATSLAADLNEEIHRIPVTVKDLHGREETRRIPLTLYRPPGAGPFPLAVVSHGRAPAQRRVLQTRQRYERLARYLVDKGFAVVVPTRVGYGETYGSFDPESAGTCEAMRVGPMARAASDQILAARDFAASLPYVDASRWIALGQSVGGLATVALSARQPAGLVAAVNFSGGTGGNPDVRPGAPCGPQVIEEALRDGTHRTAVPMLWVYWRNDQYWGEENPRRWARAWADAGGAVRFHQLPAVGSDGHRGIDIDMDTWVPLVEEYLAEAGFVRPGVPERPVPSRFARVDDVDRVPVGSRLRESLYRRFLAAPSPRAFAIGGGAVGWASGDWAMGRALALCQSRANAPCRLYAVDDAVVWNLDPERQASNATP
jgi:dienelactone hydrolase